MMMRKLKALGLMISVTTVLMSNTAFSGDRLLQANDAWFKAGQVTIATKLAQQPNMNRAKNVIIFVADGNGIPSNTAMRIYEGRKRGVIGESNILSYEAMPNLALVKLIILTPKHPIAQVQ